MLFPKCLFPRLLFLRLLFPKLLFPKPANFPPMQNRWFHFFFTFVSILFISFLAFLYVNRKELLEAGFQRNLKGKCHKGNCHIERFDIGLNQQTIHKVDITLSTGEQIRCGKIEVEVPLPRALFWLFNPFEKRLIVTSITYSDTEGDITPIQAGIQQLLAPAQHLP